MSSYIGEWLYHPLSTHSRDFYKVCGVGYADDLPLEIKFPPKAHSFVISPRTFSYCSPKHVCADRTVTFVIERAD